MKWVIPMFLVAASELGFAYLAEPGAWKYLAVFSGGAGFGAACIMLAVELQDRKLSYKP